MPELGKNLAIILEHLDDRDNAVEDDPRSPGGKGYTGLEALLQYVFDQTLATNLHDGETHILKAQSFEGACAPYADIEAAKELGEQCGTRPRPERRSASTSPTRPRRPGYDGDDRGPEARREQPAAHRARRPRSRAEPRAAPRGEPRRRRGRGDGDGAATAAARNGGGGAGGADGAPPVRLPKLDDVLPGGGAGGSKPPEVQAAPSCRTSAASRQGRGRQQDEQLLDFLLGS